MLSPTRELATQTADEAVATYYLEMVWGYIELAMGRRAVVHGAEQIQNGGICLAGHGGAWDLGLISAAEKIPTTIFGDVNLFPSI